MASRSDDGEGKPVSREPPCSDKQVLWQSDAIAAPVLLRQRPCPLRTVINCLFGRAILSLRLFLFVSILALSGAPRQLSQRESLWQRGQALRDAKASPFGRGGIAQAMTERASPSPESRHAAISCLFGRAMLSLRLLFSVSILALSGAPRQLSQRESQKAFFLTGFLHSRRKEGDSRRFY